MELFSLYTNLLPMSKKKARLYKSGYSIGGEGSRIKTTVAPVVFTARGEV